MTTKLKRGPHHVENFDDSQAMRLQKQSRWVGALFLTGRLSVSAAYAGHALASENFAPVDVGRDTGSRGLLDGLSFSGPTGTVGMDSDHQEKVVFMDGKLRSLVCEKWGFEQRAYRSQLVGDTVRFEAVQVSPDYGTMTWRGTVREGRLEARYVWEKERLFWNTHREYWFKGVISEAGHERYRAY